MPIIKSAKKALRQTRKRTILNRSKKIAFRIQLAKFKKQKDPKTLSVIYSFVDKMAKSGVIHKNKAGRIKSRLAKMLAKKKLPNLRR